MREPKQFSDKFQYIHYVPNEEIPRFVEEFISGHIITKEHLSQWRKILSWLSGKRIAGSDFVEDIISATRADGKNKIFINKLLPILKAFLAKLFKVDPIISVLPKEGEFSDVAKSEYAESVISYVLEKNNYNVARLKVAANIFIFNRGIWKIYWDESMQGEGKDGRELKGDIRIVPIDPWEVYDDPYGRFVVHKYYLPADTVIERFSGVYKKLYKKELPEIEYERYQSIDGKPLSGVPVYEYYEKKSSKHPKGRTIIIAKDKIIWEGDLPPTGIPFVITKEAIGYGEDVDLSTMKQLIPPANYYNKLVNFILNNIEVMGSIMWAIPEGEFQVVDLENTPGKILVYTPGGQPYQIQPKPLPYHITQMLQTMLMELEEIAGQHEVSHGKAPFSNMPASALSLLLEQDDTKMAMMRELFYSGLKELAIKILKLAQDKYTTERVIRIMGENRTFVSRKVSGKDITFSDVKIQVVSNMPLTKQGQINFVFQLWQNRLLQDSKKALQLLGLDSLKVFQEQIMADTNKARRENERMKGLVLAVVQGSMDINVAKEVAASYVMPDEDHSIHLQEHLAFLKEENWEELDDRTKEIYMAHINEHKRQQMALNQQLQQMAAQQKPQPETPAGGAEQMMAGGPIAGIPPELLALLQQGAGQNE